MLTYGSNARLCGRLCIRARNSEALFRDVSALVVIEVHCTNSIDRATQPVVGNDAMCVVLDGRRRRRQLLNSGFGRRVVAGPVCSINLVLVQNAPPLGNSTDMTHAPKRVQTGRSGKRGAGLRRTTLLNGETSLQWLLIARSPN